jgi:cytochrome c oxidase cbb3-type subunit 3
MRPLILLGCCAVLSGCDWMPGKPDEKLDKWKAPTEVTDFHEIYKESCLGCHGEGKYVSGAISLDNPTYLAILPEATLRQAIINGIPGTKMPPFAITNGGLLTDAQIDILVKGILAWRKPMPEGTVLPPYAAAPGNAANGQTLYDAYVKAIGETGEAGHMMVREKEKFMTNPAFLGLVSDQYLRTLIIAGRPELGIKDYLNVIPGRPLSNEDISDIVAWLISQRKNEFGQPLSPGSANTQIP